jgi:serine/threonine-protein kinase
MDLVRPMSPDPAQGPEPEAQALFAAFLEEFRGDERALEDLCARHPGHSALFRQWFRSLVEAGEVELSPYPSAGFSRTIGPYTLLSELGRGGQGAVYLAEDTRLQRKVALKVLTGLVPLPERQVHRFLREAEVASKLDHPGICAVFDAGFENDVPYIAMRYVSGESLAKILARRERLDVDRAIRLVERTARALHVAHESGIIHRDIKPGNIMVGPGDEPVILDFGLARDVEGGHQSLTAIGELLGTPAYMSPEQLSVQWTRLDRRTDVYSLGVTLFECLTLRIPFEAPTRIALFQKILHDPTPDPAKIQSDLPRDLGVVVQTALEKDRDRRYQTALLLAEDLRRVREFEPILARPSGALLKVRRWARRNPALAGALAGLMLALLAGLATSLVLLNQANRHLAGWRRMSDVRVLADLRREAEEDLWPVHPEKVTEMEAWLERARDLAGRINVHRRALEEFRRGADPLSAAELEHARANHPRSEELAALRSDAGRLQDERA